VTATDLCGNSSSCDVCYRWKVDTTAPVLAAARAQRLTWAATDPAELRECVGAGDGVRQLRRTGRHRSNLRCWRREERGLCPRAAVVLTARDLCGNSSQCVVTYKWIVDLTPPEFSGCPSDSIYLAATRPADLRHARALGRCPTTATVRSR